MAPSRSGGGFGFFLQGREKLFAPGGRKSPKRDQKQVLFWLIIFPGINLNRAFLRHFLGISWKKLRIKGVSGGCQLTIPQEGAFVLWDSGKDNSILSLFAHD